MSPENTSNRFFITLSGLPGSGKTTLAQYLDSISPGEMDPSFSALYRSVRTIPMRWLLSQHGYKGSSTVEGMQNYHRREREAGNGPAILDQLQKLENGIFIVDAIRNSDDARYMRKKLGALSIGLIIPIDVAKERFMLDNNDDKHSNNYVREQIRNPYASENTWNDYRIAARENTWELALSEYGEDPENSEHLHNSDIQLDAGVSYDSLATHTVQILGEKINSRLLDNMQ